MGLGRNRKERMKTYFTADTHLAHEGILGITARKFSSIEAHNDVILENLNRTVGEHDRLFVLGDFCWRAEESWVAKIRCKNLHLIYGNHDKAKLGRLFKTAEDVCELKLQDHKIFLSHYPHAFWPSSHYGALHLYGHVHSTREETLDAAFPGRRSMDVGVDNAKLLLGIHRPFSEDEVISILTARPGHDQVEWYRERERRLQAADK